MAIKISYEYFLNIQTKWTFFSNRRPPESFRRSVVSLFKTNGRNLNGKKETISKY